MAENTIYGNGINQEDLVALLVLFKTNLDGLCAKLDLDGGVADTNYAALVSALLVIPDTIQQTDPFCIRDQGELINYLQLFITQWAVLTAKLDLDGTVNDTDYASLWNITDVIDGQASDGIQQAGLYQGSLVRLLNTIITNFNGLLTKLDNDTGVSGTNFNSLWAITDEVDETGTVDRPLSNNNY